MAQQQSQSSGLLVIDKPKGVTSHDLVAAVRAGLHMKKVGHAGTLDPMATGVLVIGFGNATRLLNYIVEHDKTYEATIRLGRATTTDDADGELIDTPVGSNGGIEGSDLCSLLTDGCADAQAAAAAATAATADMPPTAGPSDALTACRERIQHVIDEHFIGDIEQVPNTFSAIKVNGQRAYDLARDGKDVVLKARPVTIHAFDVLDVRGGYTDASRTNGPLVDVRDRPSASADDRTACVDGCGACVDPTGTIGLCDERRDGIRLVPVIDLDVRVSCSAGTYIRALGRDLGAMLGCGGYLTSLRRTRVGRFDLAAADIAGRVVTAHVESRTFTNRDGRSVTRNRAVLDQSGDELSVRAMTMVEAVRAAMPTLEITAADAADLRFGRRIAYDVAGPTAAYVPDCADVAAIVDRARRGEAKPIVVFAKDSA